MSNVKCQMPSASTADTEHLTRNTRHAVSDAQQAELERLLSESVESVRQRERTAFDEAAAPLAGSVVIYGAGGLGRKILAGLRAIRESVNPVGVPTPLAFADLNRELWGTSLDGLPVLAPEAAAREFGSSAAFVVGVWSPGSERRFSYIKTRLTALGCSRVVSFILLFWKYPDVFLPHRRIDAPHKIAARAEDVRRAFALFEDDESRGAFLVQLARAQFWSDYDPPAAAVSEDHYFPDGLFSLRPDEVFVDGGAFDGDTIRELIRHAGGRPPFAKVVAFEPDPANFERLERYLATLPVELARRIEFHRLGVGERPERARFAADGTVDSAIDPAGSLETEIVTLDTILGPTVPTFIKMDIEGAEPEALAGGRQVIARHTPVLAICVYHQQDHLWRIPMLIHSFSEHYCLFLRRFGDEFADVVCFAVPEARLVR
jgi:FkbM family methyltransferase